MCVIHITLPPIFSLAAKPTYLPWPCFVWYSSLLIIHVWYPHNDIQTGVELSPLSNFDKIEKSKMAAITICAFIKNDKRKFVQYRSLPATLYQSYTIMWNTSKYTNITRSYTKTYTGHDSRLYIRIPLLLGRRSTRVGIGSNTHGRALPTIRILVPSSRRVSVWPTAITQSISAWYMIAWYLFT